MKQLLLDISRPVAPRLDNFVSGSNRELLEALRNACTGESKERVFYLWGEAGSGKSHLLQACAAQLDGAVYVSCGTATQLDEALIRHRLLAIDDVDLLDETGQIALFNLFNEFSSGSGTLIVSGPAAPAALSSRRDLATRLGSGLVFQVHRLDDAEKRAALRNRAVELGFFLSEESTTYLLTHWRRDLASLLAMLTAVDRHSLQSQRMVTLALIKEVMSLPTE
jgi:DnaA-homolog protein